MIVGETIGHYRIEEKIGEGGMGAVYRAVDTCLNRSVALKFIASSGEPPPDDISRLIDEARIAARLSHPNVATVFELDPGDSFIAMEYVDGESLSSRITRGALPPDEAENIIRQIAAGMAAAHSQGIVHRDLKPGNIMIKRDGTVKILDFGLARIVDSVRRTDPGKVVGSVAYMSPEQLSGAEPDERSDVWSLGVVLFEMLTGRLPYSAVYVPALMYAICHEPTPDLAVAASGAPSSLVELCERCLEKDPVRRPPTMKEIQRALGVQLESRRAPLRRKVRWGLTLALVMLASAAIWKIFDPGTGTPAAATGVRIAVLMFEDLSPSDSTNDWPLLFQTYLVNRLTGVQDVAVYDQRSLNVLLEKKGGSGSRAKVYEVTREAGADIVIEGSLVKQAGRHVVLAAGIIPATGENLFPAQADFGTNLELPAAAETIARQILDYVQVRMMHQGESANVLRPWVGTRNVSALKEFVQAGQMIFEGLPGTETSLRRAIALDSTFISPHIWLITALAQQGRKVEAANEYRFVKQLEGNASPFEQAMIGWASAYLADDLPAQIHYHELALKYSPANDILLYALGRERFIMKDYRGALRELELAARSGWEFSLVYYLLGASWLELGNDQESQAALERAATMKPFYPESQALLAVLAFRKNDRSEAERHEKAFYDGLASAGLPRSELLARMGERLATYGLAAEAAARFTRARDTNPMVGSFHDELADMLLQQGFRDSARSSYERAFGLDSNDVDARLMLGEIADSSGDAATALYHFRAIMRLDSGAAAARNIDNRIKRLSR